MSSIGSMFASAMDGDIIALSGNYTGCPASGLTIPGNKLLYFTGVSESDPNHPFISCAPSTRAFDLSNSKAVFANITFMTSGASAPSVEGYLRMTNSAVEMRDCKFLGTAANIDGSAVLAQGNTNLTIYDSVFYKTSLQAPPQADGGAFMWESTGTLTIHDSSFEENTNIGNYLIRMMKGTLNMFNTVFTKNMAGAVTGVNATINIVHPTFTTNSASTGLVRAIGGSLSITAVGTSFMGNTGEWCGVVAQCASVSLESVQFYGGLSGCVPFVAENSTLDLSGLVIQEFMISPQFSIGATMYIFGSSGTCENCAVYSNTYPMSMGASTLTIRGAGVEIAASTFHFISTLFGSNGPQGLPPDGSLGGLQGDAWGGLYIHGGSEVQCDGCQMLSNIGSAGAGAWVESSSLSVASVLLSSGYTTSQFLYNHARDQGGAIYCRDCALDVGGGVQFNANSAGSAGPILSCAASTSGASSLSFSTEITAVDNTLDVFNGAFIYGGDCAACGCCDLGFPTAPFNYTAYDCLPVQGQMCTEVSCLPGYVPRNVTCTASGFSSLFPCQSNPCPEFAAPNNGSVVYDNPHGAGVYPATGSLARFGCMYGFELSSQWPLECTMPVWNGTAPTCIPMSCPTIISPNMYTLPAITNGKMGDVASFQCGNGSMTQQPLDRLCTWGQGGMQWQGNDIVCQQIFCEDLNAQSGKGWNSSCNGSVPFGETCDVMCDNGYAGGAARPLLCIQAEANHPLSYYGAVPACTPCTASEYANPGDPTCTKCPNGYSYTDLNWDQSACLCQIGYYEATAGRGDCTICPTGGYCSGDKNPAIAAAGYYVSQGAFVACTPAAACAQGGGCNEGYEGFLCGKCKTGYYRYNGECFKCESNSDWKIALGVIAGSAVCLGLVKVVQPGHISSPQLNFAAPSIGLSFAQITASFADIKVEWPQALKDLFAAYSSLNINIELVNPECTVKMTFYDKLSFILLLPLVVAGLFILGATVMTIRYLIVDRHVKGLFRRHAAMTWTNFTAAFLLFMTLSYLYLAKAAVSFFSCFRQIEGSYTLALSPGDLCYTDEWFSLLPLALTALIFYVAGLPLVLLGIFLYLQRTRGSLAAYHHPLTSFYVQRYEREWWGWEVVVLARKLLIVVFVNIFVSDPVLQAVSCVIVMFVGGFATIAVRPYLWDKNDMVEVLTVVSSTFVLFSGLIADSNTADSGAQTGITAVVLIVTALSFLALALCMASEVYVKVIIFLKTYRLGTPVKATFEGHHQAIDSALVIDGRVITAGEDNCIKVYDVKTQTALYTLWSHADGVTCLADADAGCFLSGSSDGTVKLWHAATGRLVATWETGLRAITCMNLAHGVLSLGDRKGGVKFIPTRSKWRKAVAAQVNDLTPIDPEPEAEKLLNNALRAARGCRPTRIRPAPIEHVMQVDAAPAVPMLDLDRAVHVPHAHPDIVRCVAAARGHVYTGGNDGIVRKWNPKTGEAMMAWKLHAMAVSAVAIKDSLLYTGSEDRTIKVFDVVARELISTLAGHVGTVSSLAVAEDGTIYSGSWDNTVRVWQVSPTPKLLYPLLGHNMAVNSVCIVPASQVKLGDNDGKSEAFESSGAGEPYILTGSDDSTAKLFATSVGRVIDIQDPLETLMKKVVSSMPKNTEIEAAVLEEDVVPLVKSASELPTRSPASSRSGYSSASEDDEDNKLGELRSTITALPAHLRQKLFTSLETIAAAVSGEDKPAATTSTAIETAGGVGESMELAGTTASRGALADSKSFRVRRADAEVHGENEGTANFGEQSRATTAESEVAPLPPGQVPSEDRKED